MTTFQSYFEVQKALQNKSTSCLEITNSYLQTIKDNTHLNAFVEVFNDEAISKAKEVDKKIKNDVIFDRR